MIDVAVEYWMLNIEIENVWRIFHRDILINDDNT
jgi:hypothetical protein